MTEQGKDKSENIIRISDAFIIEGNRLYRLEDKLGGETIREFVIGKADFKLLYEALVKCYEIWVKAESEKE